jgi:hypothetical protein
MASLFYFIHASAIPQTSLTPSKLLRYSFGRYKGIITLLCLIVATVLCLVELKCIYDGSHKVKFQTAVTIHMSAFASLGMAVFASVYVVVPLGAYLNPADTYQEIFSVALILTGSTTIIQMLSICLVWKEM